MEGREQVKAGRNSEEQMVAAVKQMEASQTGIKFGAGASVLKLLFCPLRIMLGAPSFGTESRAGFAGCV